MSEYKLIVNEDGAIILDQRGVAVDAETALALLDRLDERYERPACVYVVRNAVMGAYKIGWTAQKIEARVSQIRYDVGDWQGLDVELTIPCFSTSEARQLEAELHTQFVENHLYGEWFNLTDDDLDYLWGLVGIPKPAFSGLERLAQRDRSTWKPQDKAAILQYAEELRAWLDGLVAEAES